MSEWDVFVSHASEDKKEIVEPLVRALQDAGLRVWYDKFSLKVGDRLRRSIDEGLKSSRFGIVVLSPHFFRKDWSQAELDGLTQREIGHTKVLLPLWVNVTFDDVCAYSPTLVDRVAARWSDGLPEVVRALLEAMTPSGAGSAPQASVPKKVPSSHDHLVLLLSPEGKTVILASQEVMLGDDLQVAIVARDPEESAFLAGLRTSRGKPMAVVSGLAAHLGKLESATHTRRGVDEIWKVTLKDLSNNHGGGLTEMSYNGISADQLAEMRARRILLNQHRMRKGNLQDAMLETFLRGSSTAIKAHESPFPKLYSEVGHDESMFLAAARLFAVLLLCLTDAVEHVLELKLTLKGNALQVAFRGRRARRYSNVVPPVISIQGSCTLKEDAHEH